MASATGRRRPVVERFGSRRPVECSIEELIDVHHQDGAAPADVPARPGRRPSRCRCSMRWCRRCRPVAKTAAKPVRRLGFVYMPNGATMSRVDAGGRGADARRAVADAAVRSAPFRIRWSCRPASASGRPSRWGDGNGEHSRGQTVWLSGVHPKRTEGADVASRHDRRPDRRAGDRQGHAAAVARDGARAELPRRQLRQRLQLRLLEHDLVADADRRRCRWKSIRASCSSACSATAARPAQRLAQVREDRSILDSVTGGGGRPAEAARRGRPGQGRRVPRLDARDRAAHPGGREAERRVADRAARSPDRRSRDLRRARQADVRPAALAFQADITRVFTLLLGREQTNRAYPYIGVPEAHHAISHHQNDPVKLAKAAKINTYHIELLARFAEKLKCDSRRRRHAARPLDDPAGQRPQQLRPALAHRPAARRSSAAAAGS